MSHLIESLLNFLVIFLAGAATMFGVLRDNSTSLLLGAALSVAGGLTYPVRRGPQG